MQPYWGKERVKIMAASAVTQDMWELGSEPHRQASGRSWAAATLQYTQ